MKNRFVSLINRNNRRVVHPPPWNRFISNIFSGRLENPIGEKYVSRSMLDHPWFFLSWLFSPAQQNCAAIQRIESSPTRQFIYSFIFFFKELMKSFAKIYYVRSNLARIITFSSFMFIPRPLHPPSSRKISSTPRSVDEHGSFDRRVCNSNRSSVAGTIFNETSVTFAYRDIQFCEAAKNKGSRRRKEAEVAVGGHAIK